MAIFEPIALKEMVSDEIKQRLGRYEQALAHFRKQ